MQLQPRQGFGTLYLGTPHLTGRSAFCTIQDTVAAFISGGPAAGAERRP